MKKILYEKLIQYILENQDRFYRVAYSYTRQQEDALDIVQSAVCKALEAYYEKRYEQDDGLEKELDRLETDVQVIIKLRYFEELSLKEISRITGLKLNTVKTKLYRDLKQLKENMQEADL